MSEKRSEVSSLCLCCGSQEEVSSLNTKKKLEYLPRGTVIGESALQGSTLTFQSKKSNGSKHPKSVSPNKKESQSKTTEWIKAYHHSLDADEKSVNFVSS